MIYRTNLGLQTQRLLLQPLTYAQLLMYPRNDGVLEAELGLAQHHRALDKDLIYSLDVFLIPYLVENPQHSLFATLWVLVHKAQRIIIGDISFKGAPTDKGLVEIGYGTFPEFRGNGFMTEAVAKMTYWAFSHQEINIILAETDKDNVASQKILNKNHFVPFAEAGSSSWWRLDKDIKEN
jgi:ribosomal-protein-alanine N-acetyltransferase